MFFTFYNQVFFILFPLLVRVRICVLFFSLGYSSLTTTFCKHGRICCYFVIFFSIWAGCRVHGSFCLFVFFLAELRFCNVVCEGEEPRERKMRRRREGGREGGCSSEADQYSYLRFLWSLGFLFLLVVEMGDLLGRLRIRSYLLYLRNGMTALCRDL
ncbi:hypothetical protein K440DRAFT_297052 [Wilcoxina mikolae CBS 423.85]|nr:hypothetical protein K440DRAFT_297052 [Wilcoxina mikolae CBS 423.85]